VESVAVASPTETEQKRPHPEAALKLKNKQVTAGSAPQRACMISNQQPENNPMSFNSTLRLENTGLIIGGIFGLLVSTFVVVRRSSD
jgi:hypothetical protein